MRISRSSLLILAAFMIPVVVEFRTLLLMFGIDVSIEAAVAASVVAVAAVVVWAVFPDRESHDGAETA